MITCRDDTQMAGVSQQLILGVELEKGGVVRRRLRNNCSEKPGMGQTSQPTKRAPEYPYVTNLVSQGGMQRTEC